MVYRIHFEPNGAYWCLQFSVYGLFWKTVSTSTKEPNVPQGEQPLVFKTYTEVEEYVAKKGINKAYMLHDNVGYLQTVASGAINFNVPHGWKMIRD